MNINVMSNDCVSDRCNDWPGSDSNTCNDWPGSDSNSGSDWPGRDSNTCNDWPGSDSNNCYIFRPFVLSLSSVYCNCTFSRISNAQILCVCHTCDMRMIPACIKYVTLFLCLGKHHNTSWMLRVEEFFVSESKEGKRSVSRSGQGKRSLEQVGMEAGGGS
jgi:hypothetical protein